MKRHTVAPLTIAFALLLAVPALADGEAVETSSKWAQLLGLAKSMGYFLLVMAAIFFCLFLTKKIGEKWGKH